MDETIREVLMRRDGASKEDCDELLAGAREDIWEGGQDPEEVVWEWFGLEPDYIWDPELEIGGVF